MTSVDTAKELGLLPEEFEKIKDILGRVPNFTELSAYAVMWSEHCSYKNSIVWLKKLPKSSPRMLAEAGQENAGLVDIGDGLACAFKIESHNHPSALEPYQGAATGVGGINRDIFTMGARPIAQLNTLRFGEPQLDHTKHLLRGVVKGIGDYGNAFGVPTVGGEVFFDKCYNTNPLVNAFSAGIVETDKIASAISYGVGNPVFIVGSATGKDGIHGAAFASKDITEDSIKDLPAVQVGDPFQEKLLLEATLEVIATGHVIGVQDMGAAGVICSTAEMSAKGEHGMDIQLDKVPLRQANMLPFEILLSESQERMLIVVKKGYEADILRIFDKWDLNCVQIGEVTASKELRFFMNGELAAQMPAESLVLGGGAPVYHREYQEPAYFKAYQQFDIAQVPEPKTLAEYQNIARHLLSHPNIASKRWVYEQYDSMVGTANMNSCEPADAAVVRVKGTDKAIVITVDCNARYVHAHPEVGAMIAVCESARNVVCAGGEPVAITNNLNFGNPYNPEVYWQFVGSVQGIINACEKLGTPVTGGNVSFYNQSATVDKNGGNVTNAVFPTPTIGMLGLMENLAHRTTLDFKAEGDAIYLLGTLRNDLASAEYLYSYHNIAASPAPFFDLDEEHKLQATLLKAIRAGLVASAHDVSDGGLFVALTESALPRQLGVEVSLSLPQGLRKDAALFGESQSRVVVSVKPENTVAFEQLMQAQGQAAARIGTVRGKAIRIDGDVLIELSEAADLYDNSLGRLMA
ncbi:phosphoribosylformylglycinamidine synthase subunit PurL [Eisenibacter elegans]|uniref:phosphoribosylformylglycinamidine synthase subunit PurL n=1 Tax=Eisenibacter elegans TaxID=997 RepID=UPI00041F4F28|nr:phosphoribosylformylglycinamidine synthase subunit PurL [Eisenibacter elegans]